MNYYRSNITDTLVNLLRFCTTDEVRQLTKKVGIQHKTVYYWFEGQTRPNVAVAEAMLNAMGYEVIIRKVGAND